MKRLLYQNLLSWKRNKYRNPLILNGVRQCGKTHLLQEFAANEFTHTYYFNFEKEPQLHSAFDHSLAPKEIIKALSFNLDQDIDPEQDIVIFDEIQAIPNALTSLKYFQEEMPQLALCSAGSLLGIHLNGTSFPVGKVDLLKLTPMNFLEFLLALEDKKSVELLQHCHLGSTISDLAHQHIWERLKWYFITGGLPKAVETFRDHRDNLVNAFKLTRLKQHELVNTYYSDMTKHAGKTNALHLDRIWRSIPAQLARNQDGSAKRFKFKDVVPGIDRYSRLSHAFDWLQNTGLILRVPIITSAKQPLAAYVKDESFFKAYMFDVGILGAISNLAPKTILNYDYGTYKGYFAENFIAQELSVAMYQPLYCWQQKHNEVEFVLDIEGDVLPIEVKSGWVTHCQSLQKFAAIYQSAYRTVMSARNLNIDTDHQYHQYPLYLAGQFPLSSIKTK